MTILWTNAALEPKRKFRYIVEFSGEGLTDLKFLAQTCDRPGVKIGMAEHKYFDKSFYHPGRVIWEPNPLSIKLVDIQQGGGNTVDTNRSLLQTFIKGGLSGLILQSGAVRTTGKQAAVSAVGNVSIRVLNSALNELPTAGQLPAQPSTGDTISSAAIAEEWLLKNAWLESMKPDVLDYAAEEVLTVTITLRYDWAEFKAHTDTTTINKFGA